MEYIMCQHFQSYFVSDFLHFSFSSVLQFISYSYSKSNENTCDGCFVLKLDFLLLKINFCCSLFWLNNCTDKWHESIYFILKQFCCSVIIRSANSESQIPNAFFLLIKICFIILYLKYKMFNGNVWRKKTTTNTNVQFSCKKNPILRVSIPMADKSKTNLWMRKFKMKFSLILNFVIL